MKYALLIYVDHEAEEFWESANDEQLRELAERHKAFVKLLEERGAFVGTHELGLGRTATTVRSNGSGHIISDGPFAEVAELLGGLYIVEARDLDEALEFAKALGER